jgi:diguanylate cyclase (GGDEF)-like protein/PAS domain S-box-containing protein
MYLQILYFLVVSISAAISMILSGVSWRFRRQTRAVLFFTPMMLMLALWQTASIFASLSREEDTIVFWVNTFFTAVILSAPLFLAFAMQYAGHEKWVSGLHLLALFIIPVISILLTWTNPFHHWMFRDFDYRIDGILLYIERYEYGWYFWIHTIFCYALVLIGMILIAQKAARSYHVYRRQAMILMLGVTPGVAATVVDALGLYPLIRYDISPIGFALAGVFFFVSINRTHFLNVVPIARDMLIENIGDGMLVLNEDGQIVDINPAAESLINLRSAEVIGRTVRDALQECGSYIDSRITNGIYQGEIVLTRRGQRRYCDLRISPILTRSNKLIGRLIVMHDITRRKSMEEALRASNEKLTTQLDEINNLHSLLQEQVIRDPLTGLYNRRYLNETLLREGERAARRQYPISILMIDIDHFKEINDVYGHPVGDNVLVELCGKMTTHVRSCDIIYRYGGEEFLILMLDTTRETALQRAEMIRAEIEKTVFTIDGRRLPLTISIGVATYSGDSREMWEVIDAADIALYEAKANGRNRIECDRV